MPLMPTHQSRLMIQNLRQFIANAVQSGTVTTTQQLMGYTLNARAVRETYNPNPYEVKERVAAPEFLTGRINSYRA